MFSVASFAWLHHQPHVPKVECRREFENTLRHKFINCSFRWSAEHGHNLYTCSFGSHLLINLRWHSWSVVHFVSTCLHLMFNSFYYSLNTEHTHMRFHFAWNLILWAQQSVGCELKPQRKLRNDEEEISRTQIYCSIGLSIERNNEELNAYQAGWSGLYSSLVCERAMCKYRFFLSLSIRDGKN